MSVDARTLRVAFILNRTVGECLVNLPLSAGSMHARAYVKEDGKRIVSDPGSDDTFTHIGLEYLSEGGANVVFKFLPQGTSNALPAYLQNKLLRMRKNISHALGVAEQLEAFNRHFAPLFPSQNIVRHELIEINELLAENLNALLATIDRPSERQQDTLAMYESHALLMTDMTAHQGSALLQFKPKWLAQSPNAPPRAKRCRTCALRAFRSRTRPRLTATDEQCACPLDLVGGSIERRARAAKDLTGDTRLADYLCGPAQSLLSGLLTQQTRLDPDGVLEIQPGTEAARRLCQAMTLRDCTLFLRRDADETEVRLADLDLKQESKIAQWKRVETELIEGGWYANSEDALVWREEDVCSLSRP